EFAAAMNARLVDELARRTCWVFDMDGTLTHAVHDFDDIRRRLDLPEGMPILEAIEALPAGRAREAERALYDIELDLARAATAQRGARDFVESLRESGRRVGIVTRNSEALAHVTLAACGLDDLFDRRFVVGRERCAPKPDPAGVLMLMSAWDAAPERTVMVGDYLFDLQAGRAAGAMTVLVRGSGGDRWPEHSDAEFDDFEDLALRIRGRVASA